MIEMEISGVRIEVRTNQPVVLLQEPDGLGRQLPIFVGPAEATAISLALEGAEPPRPMTHDLFVTALGSLNAELTKVTVTELRDRTFFAELEMSRGDNVFTISSRPSDGFALAVRTGTKIFVDEGVVERAGFVELADEPEPDADEVVEEFREFLNQINPEDFS